MNLRKTVYISLTIFLLLLISYNLNSKNEPNINFVLWVWERPENLYFIKNQNVSYAYLSGTITKTNTGLVTYPRQQPLRIPDNSKTQAVVRIEDISKGGELTDMDITPISDFVVRFCTKLKGNIACQIDFDAGQLQLEFYKRLLTSVRNSLPREIKLSITSLLSWCTVDRPWFADSQLDDITPMFFQLGREANIYWRKIANGELELNSLCQKSIGISTSGQIPNKKYLTNKIIYIFNNDYWNLTNWNIIKSKLENKLYER